MICAHVCNPMSQHIHRFVLHCITIVFILAYGQPDLLILKSEQVCLSLPGRLFPHIILKIYMLKATHRVVAVLMCGYSVLIFGCGFLCSIRLGAGCTTLLVLRHPRASAGIFLLLLFSHGLNERADAAEDRVDPSTLLLESSCDKCTAAATSLNFATMEYSEREAAMPAQG